MVKSQPQRSDKKGSYIYSWIYQNVAQENLATLASTPQNQAINWSNEPEIHAKERKESRKDGEREGEKKKTEHPYVFISPNPCQIGRVALVESTRENGQPQHLWSPF